eukprot:TRINITY_DN10481_c0_g1_i1.p1 TRINITY_DN10481_c0_g1~~TRINITY_DN10481_c0_g1_i1.p1  ORF type:complete len:211 (+),score=34.51 TRINITY_DN10481_c0_g1_i1:54-686(+)
MEDHLVCDVVSLGGERIHVQAGISWTVWDLKDHLWREYDIPEYETNLAHGVVKLKDADPLSLLPLASSSSRLQLTIFRSKMPLCFPDNVVDRMWQGYHAFRNSDGQSIDGKYLIKILKFGGLFKTAFFLKRLDIPHPGKFASFRELMEYLAKYRGLQCQPIGRDDLYPPEDKPIYVDELDLRRGVSGVQLFEDWEEEYSYDDSDWSVDGN